MENYQRVKELTEESANSAGTADQKYEAYMDSMAAATKRLENAWESFTMKLESSKVLRLTSEALAGIVENMDKLLPLVTSLIVATKSSSILKFFTGGEGGFLSGGFGRFIGAITGNNMKSISVDANNQVIATQTFRDKLSLKLDDIRDTLHQMVYGKPAIASGEGVITWDRAAKRDHKRKWKQYQKGTYGGDPYSLEREHASFEAAQKAETAQYWKSHIASTALAAGVGAATRLMENRQVGGDSIAQNLFHYNKTGQTIEEDSQDKALGVGLRAAGSLLGLTPLGPLGSMLGQVIGDGVADIITYHKHAAELERKQQVAQAKDNIEKLANIDSSIQAVGAEALKDDEDVNWNALSESIYNLYDSISEYTGDLQQFNDILSKYDKSINTLSSLYQSLQSPTKQIRDQAYYAIISAEKLLKHQNLLISHSIDRDEIESVRSVNLNQNLYDFIVRRNTERSDKGDYEYEDIDIMSGLRNIETYSISDQIQMIDQYIIDNADIIDDILLSDLRKRQTDLYKALADEEKLNKDETDALIDAAFNLPIGTNSEGLGKYIGQYTSYELQAMGPNEIYRFVAKNLLDLGTDIRDDISNEILPEWETKIRNYIQESYPSVYTNNQRTYGDILSLQEDITEIAKKILNNVGGYPNYPDEQYVNELRNLYNQGNIPEDLMGYDETLIGGLLYASDPERVESFAKAWGYTVEELEELNKTAPETYKILKNLSEAQAMLKPSEVDEYYKGFSSILSDISESLALSKDSLQNIINNYPQLLKYFDQEGGFLKTTAELYRILMDEQDFVYRNAVRNAYQSSTAMFDDFKNTLEVTQRDILNQLQISTFDALLEAKTTVAMRDVDILEKASEYLKKDLTYQRDNPLVSQAMEYETKMIDKQISALEEQKKALEDVNNVREKELALIKAKQKLEDAKTNKQKYYREGVGFVYEANQDAILEAQKEVESAERAKDEEAIQRDIDNLTLAKEILEKIPEQKEMEALENSMKAIVEGYDGYTGISGLSESINTLNEMYENGTATINLGEDFYQKISDIITQQQAINKMINESDELTTASEISNYIDTIIDKSQYSKDKQVVDQRSDLIRTAVNYIKDWTGEVSFEAIDEFIKGQIDSAINEIKNADDVKTKRSSLVLKAGDYLVDDATNLIEGEATSSEIFKYLESLENINSEYKTQDLNKKILSLKRQYSERFADEAMDKDDVNVDSLLQAASQLYNSEYGVTKGQDNDVQRLVNEAMVKFTGEGQAIYKNTKATQEDAQKWQNQYEEIKEKAYLEEYLVDWNDNLEEHNKNMKSVKNRQNFVNALNKFDKNTFDDETVYSILSGYGNLTDDEKTKVFGETVYDNALTSFKTHFKTQAQGIYDKAQEGEDIDESLSELITLYGKYATYLTNVPIGELLPDDVITNAKEYDDNSNYDPNRIPGSVFSQPDDWRDRDDGLIQKKWFMPKATTKPVEEPKQTGDSGVTSNSESTKSDNKVLDHLEYLASLPPVEKEGVKTNEEIKKDIDNNELRKNINNAIENDDIGEMIYSIYQLNKKQNKTSEEEIWLEGALDSLDFALQNDYDLNLELRGAVLGGAAGILGKRRDSEEIDYSELMNDIAIYRGELLLYDEKKQYDKIVNNVILPYLLNNKLIEYEGLIGDMGFWGNYKFQWNDQEISIGGISEIFKKHFHETSVEKSLNETLNNKYSSLRISDIVLHNGRFYKKVDTKYWRLLTGDEDGVDLFHSAFPNVKLADPYATGSISLPNAQTALINELGTEAIITPEGTVTSLPSKTGIIPADITKNLWALGEIAPTLVARLGSMNMPSATSNIGNTTYEEGQYIDSLTMNVYPTKDYDMDRLLAEARSKVKLTKHNN